MLQRCFLGDSKTNFPPTHQQRLHGRLWGQEERWEKGRERERLVENNDSMRVKAPKGQAEGKEMPFAPRAMPAPNTPKPCVA